MLEVGKHQFMIAEHTIREIGDKSAVVLMCRDAEDESCEVLVWITPKSMGIARKSLKVCGFDIDAEGLDVLVKQPIRLAGNKIPVLVEEWNGKLRAQIQLNPTPTRSRLDELTAQLRAAKRDGAEDEAPPPHTDEDMPF